MQTFPLDCVTTLISFCLSEFSLHHFTLVSVRRFLYATAPYVLGGRGGGGKGGREGGRFEQKAEALLLRGEEVRRV